MSYTVVKAFNDIQDNRHRYEIGDEYPRKGFTATPERIDELASSSNKRGIALIKANKVAEPVKEKEKKVAEPIEKKSTAKKKGKE